MTCRAGNQDLVSGKTENQIGFSIYLMFHLTIINDMNLAFVAKISPKCSHYNTGARLRVPGFFIPLMVIQKCSALTIAIAPLG